MKDQFVVIPGPKGDRFVELSRSPQGRVFRKQILKYGDLLYPGVKGGKVTVDENFVDTMIANFTNGVADIVQVPKVDDANRHTEDPDRNVGEVIAVHKLPKGVYVDIDVRTDDADKVGKTLLGASAMLSMDYTDTSTGKKVGPTLLHTAITNRPYITNLEPFEEVLAASQSGADIHNQMLVLSQEDTKETDPMTREEMLAALKDEHGIDVEALQAKASQADAAVALSNQVRESLIGSGILVLSNADQVVDAETLTNAVVEAGSKIVALTNQVDDLTKEAALKDATTKVEELIEEGRILPKQKDGMIELRLSNPTVFDQIVPDQPLVKLSVEEGAEPSENQQEATVEAEVERIAKAYVRQ